jgi:hypothetical protein
LLVVSVIDVDGDIGGDAIAITLFTEMPKKAIAPTTIAITLLNRLFIKSSP